MHRQVAPIIPKDVQPAVFGSPRDPGRRPWYFLSLRWKAVFPLLVVAMAASMTGAYLISDAVARGVQQSEINHLLQVERAVADRMALLDEVHQREVMRIAYTEGVAASLAAGDGRALHAILEPLAMSAGLDFLLAAGSDGREVIGLQRVVTEGGVDYAVASGTNLAKLLPPAPQSNQGGPIQSILSRTGQGYALVTAAPVMRDEEQVGVILAGTRLDGVLETLRGGDAVELAIFGPGGEFMRATLTVDDDTLGVLRLPPEIFDQALHSPGQVPVESLALDGKPYNAAYIPFVMDGRPLGVVATYAPDNTLYATTLGRQEMSVASAGLVALVVLATFVVVGRFTGRLERVTRTANDLAAGNAHARTRMKARDEIGEIGAALDRVADQHQRKTDALQKALRIQRCETARVSAVLESIPDGLVVQDLEGRVLMINDAARKLLGGQRAFRAARLHELTAVVADTLGPALAPGIYALGDPTRIPLEGRMIQAQAAAILSRPEQRIGTVIVLRDITADVEREQVRDALLDQLQQDTRPAAAQSYDSLAALAKEVTRNARSLQHVISELRDLSTFEPRDLQAAQQPLSLNDLLRHIVSEWQPFARSAQISLRVRFGPRGYHILGDDRRLRWVIGNLVDNAIKYSPPRSSVILEIRVPEDPPHLAEIVIEDHGCGIAPDDLPHVFTRFYRGTPRGPGGAPLLKPGTGQGLFIAKRVIEAHGGQIALASRVGEGTTVAVRLPLTAPVALEIPADQQGSEAAPLPDGTPYDTVPLEPRRPPRDRPS